MNVNEANVCNWLADQSKPIANQVFKKLELGAVDFFEIEKFLDKLKMSLAF